MRIIAAATLLGALAASPSSAQIPTDIDTACSGFASGPDIGSCLASSFAGRNGKLATIACVLDRLNQWKVRRLACLEEAMNKRQKIVMWPNRALRALQRRLKAVDTLREEAGKLACGWRFSERTADFKSLFETPLKLCRGSHERLWGSHDGSPRGDLHALLDQTSVLTHNMIQDRTIHDYGKSGELPEETWRRIGIEGARDIGDVFRSPGEANRFEAQMLADVLRVRVGTIGLQRQAVLVAQEARDYRRTKAEDRRALSDFMVSWLVRPSR